MNPIKRVTPERRTSERHIEVHTAKVYDQRADKYFPAETCNVSDSGVLLKVNRSMPISAGDVLDVALFEDDNGPVIGHQEMAGSEVVRVVSIDRFTQAIAVRYTVKPALALRAA